MKRAEGRTSSSARLRTAALLAEHSGQREEALKGWRAVLANEPCAQDAHLAVARNLELTAGPSAARAHIAEACQRFPHHVVLLMLRVGSLEACPPSEIELALQDLIAKAPENAWAHRKLANLRLAQGKLDEAIASCDRAAAIDPVHPEVFLIRGRIFDTKSQNEDALATWRNVVERHPDLPEAVERLVQSVRGGPHRRTELDFVAEAIAERAITGESVELWWTMSLSSFKPENLLRRVNELLHERPDLAPVWAVAIRQRRVMGRLGVALAQSEEASRRFPLVPGIWLERADVQRALGDSAGELAAARQAVDIHPWNAAAVSRLAAVFDLRGDPVQAIEVLERGLHYAPLETQLIRMQAQHLRRIGDHDRARQRLHHALELAPSEESTWKILQSWCLPSDESKELVLLAEKTAEARAWNPDSWVRLAEICRDQGLHQQALQAVDRALELDSSHVFARRTKAEVLTNMRDRAGALAACEEKGAPSVELALTEAWVQAQFGDLKKAIARMKKVLAEHPDTLMGWAHLTEWCEQIGDVDGQVKAAERMVITAGTRGPLATV